MERDCMKRFFFNVCHFIIKWCSHFLDENYKVSNDKIPGVYLIVLKYILEIDICVRYVHLYIGVHLLTCIILLPTHLLGIQTWRVCAIRVMILENFNTFPIKGDSFSSSLHCAFCYNAQTLRKFGYDLKWQPLRLSARLPYKGLAFSWYNKIIIYLQLLVVNLGRHETYRSLP